ncbi:MAG TPA: redoxin domain-containing protein [Chryseosolibacter sp.]
MIRMFSAVVILSCLTVACSPKKEETAQVSARQVNEYPDLILTFSNGEKMSTKTLKGNNVLVMFQPDCDHCQQEAIQIEQRLEEFKDYTLYFVSSSPMEQIMAFAKNFNLDGKQNVKFAWTTSESVLTYYGPIPTPSIYVYSKGELRSSFNGQTEVEEILKSL